jgi:hypothetical protein
LLLKNEKKNATLVFGIKRTVVKELEEIQGLLSLQFAKLMWKPKQVTMDSKYCDCTEYFN